MELVTSEFNILFSSSFLGPGGFWKEEWNKTATNLHNYSEKCLIDEIIKIKQSRMGWHTPLAGSPLIIASSELKFIQKNRIRDSRDCYLHEDLHAIANVIFGSVKIILQDVKETKLLAVMHFYNGFLLFCLHCLINKS